MSSKLQNLTALTALTADDLLYALNDPGGTPADRYITFQNLVDSLLGTTRLTALTAYTAPTDDDLLWAIDDPGGTPLSRKLTMANLRLLMAQNFFQVVAYAGASGALTCATRPTIYRVTLDGTFTANLPAAASYPGLVLGFDIVSLSSTNTLTLDGNSSELIEGYATEIMRKVGHTLFLQSDGTGWIIVFGVPDSSVECDTPTGSSGGHGSTNTKIRDFTNVTNVGNCATGAASATAGTTITINRTGLYSCSRCDVHSTTASSMGISRGSNQLTTSIPSVTTAHQLILGGFGAAVFGECGRIAHLSAGEILRAHAGGTPPDSTAAGAKFIVRRVA